LKKKGISSKKVLFFLIKTLFYLKEMRTFEANYCVLVTQIVFSEYDVDPCWPFVDLVVSLLSLEPDSEHHEQQAAVKS